MKKYLLKDLASQIGAELITANAQNLAITGVNSTALASVTEVTFLTSNKFLSELKNSKAAAVILAKPIADINIPQLTHPNPQLAMAKLSQIFYARHHSFSGQSSLATIEEGAHVAKSATIFPFAYVAKGAHIGEEAILYPHVFVGMNGEVGARSLLYAGVQIMDSCKVGADCVIFGGTVIGADGFGFVPNKEGLTKIPQIGNVEIEDDVEIGPLCTIDRATYGSTRIKKGAKLDSHVHVGHNVSVGEATMLCAQVGIAGTTTIGSRCIAAGQVGFANGLEVGSNIIFGGQAGVTHSVSEAGTYHGMPIKPAKEWTRQMVALEKLPELLKRVRHLEDELARLNVVEPPSSHEQ